MWRQRPEDRTETGHRPGPRSAAGSSPSSSEGNGGPPESPSRGEPSMSRQPSPPVVGLSGLSLESRPSSSAPPTSSHHDDDLSNGDKTERKVRLEEPRLDSFRERWTSPTPSLSLMSTDAESEDEDDAGTVAMRAANSKQPSTLPDAIGLASVSRGRAATWRVGSHCLDTGTDGKPHDGKSGGSEPRTEGDSAPVFMEINTGDTPDPEEEVAVAALKTVPKKRQRSLELKIRPPVVDSDDSPLTSLPESSGKGGIARPPKASSISKASKPPVPKKRGLSPKSKSDTLPPPAAKRGPGRPRKHPKPVPVDLEMKRLKRERRLAEGFADRTGVVSLQLRVSVNA